MIRRKWLCYLFNQAKLVFRCTWTFNKTESTVNGGLRLEESGFFGSFIDFNWNPFRGWGFLEGKMGERWQRERMYLKSYFVIRCYWFFIGTFRRFSSNFFLSLVLKHEPRSLFHLRDLWWLNQQIVMNVTKVWDCKRLQHLRPASSLRTSGVRKSK